MGAVQEVDTIDLGFIRTEKLKIRRLKAYDSCEAITRLDRLYRQVWAYVTLNNLDIEEAGPLMQELNR